ncbi:hypothetical protein R6Q57_006953 [Mikania cordata]
MEKALQEAANLSGWDLRKTADGHEAKVIKLIAQRVSLELRPFDANVDVNLIGMERRMQDLEPCLEIGLNDVRMIGIKGKSFVENVREISKSPLYGLKKLQEQVLTDVLKDKSITVSGVHEGKHLLKKKVCGKKALVVLDDVDHKDQLEMLAGDLAWFKPESRIIITTRDEHVLDAHRVKWIHDVNLLSEEEAICLFNRHAFRKDIPTQEYERYSREVIRYVAGLPLTIKVLGSDLCGKYDNEQRDVLERLKTIPLKETLRILELSYENLEEDYKEIFLDVACFLRGWKIDDAIIMLESCGFYAKNALRVFAKKSLTTLGKSYDLNAEPNVDVRFDSQASYGFVYDDSKQSNPEEAYEEKSAASNINWETKEEFMSEEALVGWVKSRALDNGYIVVKRRTKKSKTTCSVIKVWLMCDRGGEHNSIAILRRSGSKKIGCPFQMIGYTTKFVNPGNYT